MKPSNAKKYLTLVAAAFCLGLTACSDDSKDAVHNIRAEPDLQGSFSDECVSPKAAGQRVRLNFEGNSYTRSQIFYSESDCVNETGRLEYKGEFVAGELNKEDPRKGGTMDLVIQEVKFNVTSDKLAKALNEIKYCGHTDFAAGKEINFTEDLKDPSCPLTKVPLNLYTLYRLENDRLYFADKDIFSMTETPEKRTEYIDYEKAYLKDGANDGQSKTAEVKEDVDKTLDEAKDDVKKTAEQAETDVKQAADRVENKAKEIDAKN